MEGKVWVFTRSDLRRVFFEEVVSQDLGLEVVDGYEILGEKGFPEEQIPLLIIDVDGLNGRCLNTGQLISRANEYCLQRKIPLLIISEEPEEYRFGDPLLVDRVTSSPRWVVRFKVDPIRKILQEIPKNKEVKSRRVYRRGLSRKTGPVLNSGR